MTISNLDRPNFIDRNPNAITEAIKAEWERLASKTLYPAQSDRIFIDVMSYRETLVRNAIQEAAEQNLLAFARAPMLDYLGDLMGVYRLAGSAAKTTLTFTLDGVRQSDTLIPKGTQVANQASQGVVFITDDALNLMAGQLSGNITASAQVAGSAANELSEGSLIYIVDALGLSGVSVRNGSIKGGADAESDNQLRERIRLAPEIFSTAGCRLAYKFHALSANPTIIDATPVRAGNGDIYIYVLTKTGTASEEILKQVEDSCNDLQRRPISDEVFTFTGIEKTYELDVTITPYETADLKKVQETVEKSAREYVEEKQTKLGLDIDPSQIIDSIFSDGVYKVTVNKPSDTLVIEESEWAKCTDISVTLAGAVNG